MRELWRVAAATGAVAAFLAYFVGLARRPSWVRLLNGSGLVFTGLALAGVAGLVAEVAPALSGVAELTTAALLLATAAQAWSGLRNRRAWDGVDRRAGPTP